MKWIPAFAGMTNRFMLLSMNELSPQPIPKTVSLSYENPKKIWKTLHFVLTPFFGHDMLWKVVGLLPCGASQEGTRLESGANP